MVRDHGFHSVRIARIIQETADARTYVLDAPTTSPSPFTYRAGQFLTVRVCGTLRSYSMSSSPDTDAELMTTVKRVPGGQVSNWMHDHLVPGDVIEVTRPAGVFCLRETPAPLVAFGGGSGITPILSLAKSALATTSRRGPGPAGQPGRRSRPLSGAPDRPPPPRTNPLPGRPLPDGTGRHPV